MKTKHIYLVLTPILLIVAAVLIWQFNIKYIINDQNKEKTHFFQNLAITTNLTWETKDIISVDPRSYDSTDAYSFHLSKGNLKLFIDSENLTPKPLSYQEAQVLSQQRKEIVPSFNEEEFYFYQPYMPSNYIDIGTISGKKLVRPTVEYAKTLGEGKIGNFTVFMVDGEKVTSQLRILGRDKNTDRINISYIIDPPYDEKNVPADLEKQLQECDEIVRSLKVVE